MEMYRIGEVANMAGLSQRALRHYDEVGLLTPSERTDSGYRLYTTQDLERLQEILLYRELGVALDRIAIIINDPRADRRAILEEQRTQLSERIAKLSAMSELVEQALASMETGAAMDPKEMLSVFGDFDPAEYEAEARARWGNSNAYRESAQRTKSYSKSDWERICDRNKAIDESLVAAFDRGIAADAPEAMDIAEEARLVIDRNFYSCSHEMHTQLAEMYVADQRFRDHYDRRRDGLAEWLVKAIRANTRRAETN